MKWRLAVGVSVLCGACVVGTAPAAEPGRVIGVVEDFEGVAVGTVRPGVVFWQWTAAQKADALRYSRCEVVGGAAVGQKCLKLSVSEEIPPQPAGYRMVSLGVDYLPPEADAVRMRVKGLKGRVTVSVGGRRCISATVM